MSMMSIFYTRISPKSFCLLLQGSNFLDNLVVGLSVLLGLVSVLLGLSAAWNNKDTRSWSLGGAGRSQIFLGWDENERNSRIFTKNWDVGDDICWGNVAGDDHKTLFALSQSLDDFLHTSLDMLGFRCFFHRFEHFFVQFFGSKRLGERQNGRHSLFVVVLAGLFHFVLLGHFCGCFRLGSGKNV
ncbi:hypothetical protein EJF18_40110 [Clavispora lusitaniae]|uniref:Uncharacterized protein n=2 Tax=Clavispora lusitaniae TaxID=36911 RepID=C4Y575_CLAL4|nr:uncharacterized protein CLUG_03309 [Clavispora lusitaniae ATCC 42720]KAF7582824.1 putative integral membrane protein [Clavispora lusitaniae]EEQ39181.1 hypothetical protein CLUG_03309 [Clavispora lusitaniae ATCC 42720]QFZ28086.1 hypothetical protein EJF14_40110 [Clavispora lusitaniae]QFZ33749.1 hypothetical protein EJF16_40110 [Clavispora lusitaniae]QFZ39433.1 hypothetical protein EJF15_40110 [Clavispora lusitaniae]